MKTKALTIRIEEDLRQFITDYATANYTTVSHLLIQYIVSLKQKQAPVEGGTLKDREVE